MTVSRLLTLQQLTSREFKLHFWYDWQDRFWRYGGYWFEGELCRRKVDDP